MSPFRSFENGVKILCLPETTFARGSEDNSREELGASRCSWTLPSTRFSVNSSNHPGRSRNGSLRTTSLSFLRDESPHSYSQHLSDAGCCAGITNSCDEDVGDVGEDELEELVDRPRTTIGT